MNGKGSNSLKELRSLREAVLSEEKAKVKAIIETLPPNQAAPKRNPEPAPEPTTEPQPEPASSANPASLEALELANDPLGAEPVLETEDDPDEFTTTEHNQVLPVADIDDDPLAPPPPTPAPVTPAPIPAPIPKPAAQPPSPPVAQAPASPAPSPRLKPAKENTLLIPLASKMQDRLLRHVEQSRWSPADLVIELIRSQLHRGYPAIVCGDQLLARAGAYRTVERNPFESVLTIVSGQGVFNIRVRADSPEYQRWLAHFQAHKSNAADQAAVQVCLFELQKYLDNVEDFALDDWTKRIAPGAYSVESLV